MRGKPNASLNDDQVWEILIRLREIDGTNPNNDTQAQIAADYRVEKKTISRIKNGETWGSLKLRFDERHNCQSASASFPGDDTLDLLDTIGKVKTAWGLDVETPLHFGRYDWIDGVHWVVTDGTILWESYDLFNLATKAEGSGIEEHPVFARMACELPTFQLSKIMTRPVGDKFVEREEFNTGVVRLTSEEGRTVFLKAQYIEIIDRLKLDVHIAGRQLKFVYLVQTKTTPHKEDQVIFAAVATVEIP